MLPFDQVGNDIGKTLRYARRNGVRKTFFAASEKLRERLRDPYRYEPPSDSALAEQRRDWKRLAEGEEPEEVFRFAPRFSAAPRFSILVPACDPQKKHFRALVESVLSQTYGGFELIIADAGTTSGVKAVLADYDDERIVYRRLAKNGGISENTNSAAAFATGDYVAFLDHDDLLTPDALYQNAVCILRTGAEIVYSDEDKCDTAGKIFFEPNRKPDFNLDLLYTNNYICHFLVMRRELFGALGLRSRFDGAQDYDLVLRAPKSSICHVPRVLYHWRTHARSTAGNPASKMYAYDAGRDALQDYFDSVGIRAEVDHDKHRGYYRVEYRPDIFTARPDVGVVGGRILNGKDRIIGGMMDEEGHVLYENCHALESGPMHRAICRQNAVAVDARCMKITDALRPLYEEVFGEAYERHIMQDKSKVKEQSIAFCRAAAKRGYLIVWDPGLTRQFSDR